MLDTKECQFRLYEPVFKELSPMIQKRIKAVYDSRESFVERMALLVYAAYSVKAKKIGCSLDAALHFMAKQAPAFDGYDPEKFVVALQIVEVFNKMNNAYIQYKRDNYGEQIPYVEFEPCFWYIEALRLLALVEPLDYPLMDSWKEFFLFLPLCIDPMSVKGGLNFKLMDYVYAVKDGKFERWYQKAKGYGPKVSGFNREGFRGMYVEELASMSVDELNDELLRHGWGYPLAKQELEKRNGL